MLDSKDLNKITKSQNRYKDYQRKFLVALTDYLVNLYENKSREPGFAEELVERFTEEKLNIINGVIKEMKQSVRDFKEKNITPYFFIQSGDKLENFPYIFIKLMKFLCELHEQNITEGTERCLAFFKEFDDSIYDDLWTPGQVLLYFEKLNEFCDTYELNQYQYLPDDEFKELMLAKLDDSSTDSDKQSLFYEPLKTILKHEAAAYVSFYDTLSELARTREEYKNAKDLRQLYRDANLSTDYSHTVHDDHKCKHYQPVQRRDVMSLILTLKLNMDEADRLLKAAGFQFGDSPADKLIKSMIITKKWSWSLYNEFIKKYYCLFYTLEDNIDKATGAVNHEKILAALARQNKYVQKDAVLFYLESIEGSGNNCQSPANAVKTGKALLNSYKDKKDRYSCDLSFIAKVFHLNERNLQLYANDIEDEISLIQEGSGKRANKNILLEKIGCFIFKEHTKAEPNFTDNEADLLKNLIIYISLDELLPQKALCKLKEHTARIIQQNGFIKIKQLYWNIYDSLHQNRNNGQRANAYLEVLLLYCKGLTENNRRLNSASEIIKRLNDNDIIAVEFKAIDNKDRIAALRKLSKNEGSLIKEYYKKAFSMQDFIAHVTQFFRDRVIEIFNQVFNLKELFERDFVNNLKKLAKFNEKRSQNGIEQVYSDVFKEKAQEKFCMHREHGFSPNNMDEADLEKLRDHLNADIESIDGEKMFIINYFKEDKDIKDPTFRGYFNKNKDN